jgi:hypothetical protein
MAKNDYHFESFVDPSGRELQLPSLLKVAVCHLCRCLVVRRRLSDWMLAALRPYTKSGWVRYRNATNIANRPTCEMCHLDWVEMNSAKGVQDAAD